MARIQKKIFWPTLTCPNTRAGELEAPLSCNQQRASLLPLRILGLLTWSSKALRGFFRPKYKKKNDLISVRCVLSRRVTSFPSLFSTLLTHTGGLSGNQICQPILLFLVLLSYYECFFTTVYLSEYGKHNLALWALIFDYCYNYSIY